jgi:hypothetical protein
MMADTQPNQAMGTGKPDSKDGIEDPHGKTGGGESSGGAYPNPHTGHGNEGNSGFMGHGGQSNIEYSGTGSDDDPDAENENAATR